MTRKHLFFFLLEAILGASLGIDLYETSPDFGLGDLKKFLDLLLTKETSAGGLFPEDESGFNLDEVFKYWGFDLEDDTSTPTPKNISPLPSDAKNATEFSGIYHAAGDSEELSPRISQLEDTTDGDCNENRTDRVHIVWRSDWNAAQSTSRFPTRSLPSEYVVISQAGRRCYDNNTCIARIQEEQKRYMRQYGDLVSNFYIGDDGLVYEGLGWNQYHGTFFGGLGETSLSVTFFGNLQFELPSPVAMHALDLLIKEGVCTGKISPAYKYISIRMYYDDWRYLGDAMADDMKTWGRYVEDFDSLLTRDHGTAGLFPVVFRAEWRASPPRTKMHSLDGVAEYVVVRDWGNRCFTTAACVEAMQTDQQYGFENFGEVPHSFYVGDDGLTYEGRGWDLLPLDNFRNENKTIVVVFFGQYITYPPSPRAFMAFWKLLELGVWMGKLSPHYKILSYRTLYPDARYPGNALHNALRSMERYAEVA